MGKTAGAEPRWLDAGDGYALAVAEGKLRCRNDKGKVLKSVPKKVKASPVAEQLSAMLAWLDEHERACRETVEEWMLRSLPTPRTVLERVWEDPAWQAPLRNAVVLSVDASGARDQQSAGLLRGVDADKGLGVVNLEGETEWIAATFVALPHPMLIEDRDDFRELLTELDATQGISQLLRDCFDKPAKLADGQKTIDDFNDGKFLQLNHALGRCRTLGYRVRGGFSVCPVIEDGTLCEARFWIGSEDPEFETYTGELLWVDGDERAIPIAEVGPVAFSEGMRMASSIYGGRVVDKDGEQS